MMIFTPLATRYFLSVQRFLECLLCAKHVFDSGPSKDNRVGCFPGGGGPAFEETYCASGQL